MPRPKKYPTKLVRVRIEDAQQLVEQARRAGMSFPDYIAYLRRRFR